MDKLKLTKFVVSNVAGYGASILIGHVIGNTIAIGATSISKKDKLLMFAGSLAIGWYVSDKIKTYVDETIDDAVDTYKSLRAETNK